MGSEVVIGHGRGEARGGGRGGEVDAVLADLLLSAQGQLACCVASESQDEAVTLAGLARV